jgi:Tfp pilus assembly protein PilF
MSRPEIQQLFESAIRHQEAGRIAEAIADYRRLLEIDSDVVEAQNNLGNALAATGKWAEAIACYRRALQIAPAFSQAQMNLAHALHNLALNYYGQGKLDEAIAHFTQAIDAKPNFPEAHNNLGNALLEKRDTEIALSHFRQALELRPDLAQAHVNIGNALRDSGNMAGAIDSYRSAVAARPEDAHAHYALGIALLSLGQFPEGWKEFEWRLRMPHLGLRRSFSAPQWKGEDVRGKRILLHAEGGHGDALQFVRYVDRVQRLGAEVSLECQSALVSLFAQSQEIGKCFARGESLPPFDFHSSLVSLPMIFGADSDSIASNVPYLKTSEAKIELWRKKIGNQNKFKVGIAWAGSRLVKDNRSRDLAVFEPLLKIAGADFYSLQFGDEAGQADSMNVYKVLNANSDFADSAAMVSNLDLVISVDTSTAHLAGALGKPVWVLLPRIPDWRWLLEGSHSPWYPTMTLFRQKRAGDWDTPISEMVESLRAKIGG